MFIACSRFVSYTSITCILRPLLKIFSTRNKNCFQILQAEFLPQALDLYFKEKEKSFKLASNRRFIAMKIKLILIS